MTTTRKYLLVRADFVLDRSRGGSRLLFKRWRRALADSFPRLMGCAKRCDFSAVRLHFSEEEGRFTGWLRLPVERLPSRDGLLKIAAKLRERLETALLAVGGEVIKLGVRRYRVNENAAVPDLKMAEPNAA